jgi:hypothetical protein
VRARIIWTRRTGFLRQTIGLEFQDVSDEDTAKLARLAHSAARKPMLGQNAAACDR